jgi:hypothetical protein
MIHYEDKPYLPDPFSLKTEIIRGANIIGEITSTCMPMCFISQTRFRSIHMSSGKGRHMSSLFRCDCTKQHHSVTGAVGVQYFRISIS